MILTTLATSAVAVILSAVLGADPPAVAPPPRAVKSVFEDQPRGASKVWLSRLADGYTQAKRRRQPILVRAVSESCPWCRKLEAELRDAALAKELDRWTLVAIDVASADRDARALAVGPVPALRLLTPDGRIVASRDGFLRAKELQDWLQKNHDKAAVAPATDLITPGEPDGAAVLRLVVQLNQRDPTLREAAIGRLLPHPKLAAKPVSEAFAKGSLQSRLAAIELLRAWQAPVQEFDPWRPETLSTARLEALAKWALAPPDVQPLVARPLTPGELKSVQEDLARLVTASDVEASAIRERLARLGQPLLANVYAALKDAPTDTARERLTALRYRLAAGATLTLRWPGGLDRLAASNPTIRHEAVQELARIAAAADEPLLLELFGNSDPLVRELSLRTLHAVAGRTATGSLTRLLRDPDPNVRVAVLKQLAETPSPKVVPQVAEYLGGETDLDLVVHAIRVLRAAGGDDAIGVLKPLLQHASWRVRAEAVEALGECIGTRVDGMMSAVKSDAYGAIRAALTDADGFVVGRAIGVLKKTAREAEIEPLVRAAAAHPELAGEVVAALSYGSEFRDKVLPHLRAFCQHADPVVRASAIAAVCNDAPDDAANELRAGLTDRVDRVREAAAAQVFNVLDRKRSRAMDSDDRSIRMRDGKSAALQIDTRTAELRGGKGRPEGFAELLPLLEPLLKAKSPAERAEAALALLAMDRIKESRPVLLEAAKTDVRLVGRAATGLPWLPWQQRNDLFAHLVSLQPNDEGLESLLRYFAEVPDPRAADPIWDVAAQSNISPAAAGHLANARLMLAGPYDRYSRAQVQTPARKLLAEDARAKVRAGSEMQRLAALVVLADVDKAGAATAASAIFGDVKNPPGLRRDAFQVMLLTQAREEATTAAVKSLAAQDAGIRSAAALFLSIGTGPLRQLRDKQIYLNVNERDSSSYGRLDLSRYVPRVPAGLDRRALRELLQDPDPVTAAAGGYLLCLLGDDAGLSMLIRYWHESARDDNDWIWLVAMAIACIDDDKSVLVLEEIYRDLAPTGGDRRDTTQIRDVYWIIRPMSGANALRLRKTIRTEMGIPALGLDN